MGQKMFSGRSNFVPDYFSLEGERTGHPDPLMEMDDETKQVVSTIAALVTGAQRRSGLSDAALARRARVARAELEGLKRAEIDPDLETIYRLAGALAVEPSHLIGGVEWVPDEISGGGRFRLDTEDPD